ncbi:hypothetical protein UFOVP1301_21 [uncultured Caudovirales phage]|uniref:Uncharacterized protein n=1 Tax=uncultured Caudovirales phage TaxID=2100421 RepID=A0A6J5QKR7_9CAUD|nr:hypothetical protein UFOVP663_6 [uncultured Caudovirales phage]CAB4168749.1 hypothetical protein UFOVP894_54 [uncultured Caudovirales phage]CAB4181545.1 hypothetical protein UFOVP1069_46 [uncultured Caudovirales phage]CAB4195590.1 hypothetical protein UFOVP1301_21 [uncultured Caudovirales phage]CAB4210502.1 hypothetical protein UFOVP1415_20 [uncultured Caudovirales phage]
MPHASLKLIPGVNQNRTPTLNEAAISDSQLIRFVPDAQGIGLPQKLGGWIKYFPNAMTSIVRALWAWADINNNYYLAVGAEAFLGIISNGTFTDITPRTFTVDVPVKVETVQGSNEVTINDGNNFTYATTATTGNGTTATITFAETHTFPVGSLVVVAGVTPAGYNGTFTVTASTSHTVSFEDATTGVQTVPGTITNLSGISSFDTVDIRTQISVGGLILFGTYQCYYVSNTAYKIYTTNPATGEPAYATFTTSTITVTGASGDGTTAVLTFSAIAAATVPAVGSYVTVTGVLPSGYNGSFIVTASSTTSLSYKSTFSTGYTSGGSIKNYGTVPLFSTADDSPIVTVQFPNHGYVVGDTFTVLVDLETNGVQIYGNYTIISVTDSYTFTIQVSNSAEAPASSLVPLNGGLAEYLYYIGLVTVPSGAGYGDGGYSEGGYGIGVTPTAPSGVPITSLDWTLDNFGEILIACQSGPIFTWSPSENQANATIIPTAPIVNAGIFVAMPQRQIIAFGSTFTGIGDPLLVRWCDIENYNSWIGTVTNQAGSYRIPKGSKIIFGLQAAQQGLLWTDLALWSMQYVGQPYIYSFNEIGVGCGLIAPKAAAVLSGSVYWMSQSQFFLYSGSGVEAIYCPVWDVIFQDLDTTNLSKIRSAANSRYGEIAWYYPTISGGGEITNYVKYNINLKQWDFGTLPRTAWINQSVLGPPIGADPVTGYIVQHEMSPNANADAAFPTSTGTPITSYFQTGYFALNEADVKVFVDQIWADMKWGYYGGSQNANVNITFYVTDYPSVAPTVAYTQQMTQNMVPEYLTPRFRARLMAIKIGSSDIGSFWRLGNIRYRTQIDGKF